MRKPRDFDSALRALTDKTKTLRENKRRQQNSVVPTHIDHWSLAAAPIRIGGLVTFAAAVGDAGIPFVKGHREPADREWPRKRHAMLWAFDVNAIPFAFR